MSDIGWRSVLEGKKVLVVSPFIDSIAHQVPNKKRIFRSLEIPKVDFQYLRAPMTQGGLLDGSSFREHLQKLKNEMSSIDFDLAMISAGAYSLPLANWAKGIGKIGIHAGGAMQLFLGSPVKDMTVTQKSRDTSMSIGNVHFHMSALSTGKASKVGVIGEVEKTMKRPSQLISLM